MAAGWNTVSQSKTWEDGHSLTLFISFIKCHHIHTLNPELLFYQQGRWQNFLSGLDILNSATGLFHHWGYKASKNFQKLFMVTLKLLSVSWIKSPQSGSAQESGRSRKILSRRYWNNGDSHESCHAYVCSHEKSSCPLSIHGNAKRVLIDGNEVYINKHLSVIGGRTRFPYFARFSKSPSRQKWLRRPSGYWSSTGGRCSWKVQ